MSTIIAYFPWEIKNLALKRQKEAGFPENPNIELNSKESFNWENTPEGFDFWDMIYIEEYDIFKFFYPNGIENSKN